MNKWKRYGIWFGIGIAFTFITSMILLTSYVGIEINDKALETYFYISVLVGLIFVGSSSGRTHFGTFPFLLGLIVMLWGGLALWGSLELSSLKKEAWWSIEPEINRNIAIITFVGSVLFFTGAAWIGQNLFFIRFFKRGK